MRLDDFQYDLPPDLIAQRPSPRRDESRLMVLDRAGRSISAAVFSDLPDLLPPDALLVVNDARVIPARLYGRLLDGREVELLILDPPPPEAGPGPAELECLARPAKRLKPGTRLVCGGKLPAEVVRTGEKGRRVVMFDFPAAPAEVLGELGRMPLPPYIRRDPDDAAADRLDKERYQTVYAARPGAVAAPTAGLHFTPGLMARLEQRGLETVGLTLDVGYGTFAPVREEDITRHCMHSERVVLPEETAAAVNEARDLGRPVMAVGTTVVRALEAAARRGPRLEGFDGPVDLFIYPGFDFRVVDHVVTNFHLPGSTLVMLAAAFAGREFILEAYRRAVAEGYRFYSYGDAMLIL